MTTDLLETDVLVIGSGIAGTTTALKLADAGVPVTLITRSRTPESSNSFWAQGGIIYQSKTNNPDLLVSDILHAGAGHSFPHAARILAEEGPARVRELLIERAAVPFDRTPTGDLEIIREAAHSEPRIIHAADATGKAIEIGLLNLVNAHPNITLLTGHTAVDLLTPAHHSLDRLAVYEAHHCVGAYALNRDSGEIIRILARQTVLATGGLGQVFLRTTNPAGSRGDGLAMAYRAGARVINNEFVQFHPTTFHKEGAPNFLISEAVRGAGARLVHADGTPFMQNYDAEWKDLAPRDVVARSIHQEMLTRDLTHVYLDLRSYIEPETIKSHFPNIREECLKYGVDILTDLVPVVPGAHYACGGVWVDDWGRTTVDHLYAVGEVACTGLHGANRLASTSLLEGLVWGHRAAQSILATLPTVERPAADHLPPWTVTSTEDPDPALITQDMGTIKHIMWNYVGLVRSKSRLARALRELNALELEIENFYHNTRVTDSLLGLRNAARTAILITRDAWRNKRSMGCHYRVS